MDNKIKEIIVGDFTRHMSKRDKWELVVIWGVAFILPIAFYIWVMLYAKGII